MKRFAALAVLTAGALALPSLALADDGAFRVRAGLASVSYVSPGTDPGDPDLKSTYGAVALGASYVSSTGWFGDIGFRNSLSAEWNAKDLGFDRDDDFKRNEVTVSIGKALGDGLAVFGGVQTTKAELTISASNTIGGFSLGEFKAEEKGTLFFAGASKAFAAGPGNLTVSGALGVLSKKLTDNQGSPEEKSDSGAGVSLGAAYAYPLTQKVSLLGDLRYQSYSVEWSGQKARENVTSLGVSVVGQF